jgi:hypothetical protein
VKEFEVVVQTFVDCDASFMQVMQKHQKYFAVSDNSGRLLPYFIAVRHSYQLYQLCNIILLFECQG